MLASVIVITRNRPHVILNCLKSLLNQDYKPFEIIVVDSSSDDKTKQIVNQYPEIKYIYFENGKSKRPDSKNLGIEASRGEIVAFVDDDTLCDPEWLSECVKSYHAPDIGVVGGRILEPDTKNLDHYRDVQVGQITTTGEFISNYDCDTGKIIEVDTLRGCNMSFRKEVFEKVGNFDINYTGNNCREEADIITRAKKSGFKVVFNPKMSLEHLVEKREDVDRIKTSTRSNFYIVKNTVYYYLKNYGPFDNKSLMYILTKDTSIFYFLNTFSLKALLLVFVGIIGKIAGIWSYLRWLVNTGLRK